jgi:hypothetical protein
MSLPEVVFNISFNGFFSTSWCSKVLQYFRRMTRVLQSTTSGTRGLDADVSFFRMGFGGDLVLQHFLPAKCFLPPCPD